MKKIYILTLLVLTFISCSGQAGKAYSGGNTATRSSASGLSAKSEKGHDLLSVNSMLISPVQIDRSMRGAIPSKFNADEALRAAIESSVQLKVVFDEQTGQQNLQQSDFISRAKKQGLDGVLITKIMNFVPRQGSAYGSARPAAVDFTMRLVRVSDAKVVWDSNFFYKDQALSDNLLKIGEKFSRENGPAFKSAEELLADGYNKALGDLTQRRYEQFSAN